MFGLIIAAILTIILFARKQPGAVIFKKTSGFLFRWYSVVAFIVLLVSVVGTVIGTTSLGFLTGGPLGAVFGSFAGGALALLILFWVVIAFILQIAGAKVAHDSLNINPDESVAIDTKRLAIGLVMLFIGIFGLPFLS